MMTVDRCLFVNRAPFKENLEICFQDGVNVLCGINGRGKTTILSYIVDAIHEMAKLNFQESFEGKENKYYRISSGSHLIDPNKPGVVYIRFRLEKKTIDYIDVRGNLSETDYSEYVRYNGKIEYQKIKDKIGNRDNVKMFSCNDSEPALKETFLRNVITYFPSYRYELPGYLNIPYKSDIEISNSIRFTGELPNPLEVRTGLDAFSSWLLDVVLDWVVNKDVKKVKEQEQEIELDITPERMLWQNLSSMMKSILAAKNYQGLVRFGIGRRSNTGNRISVMHDMPNDQSEQLCPNLALLSSGETALMCLFGEIIRQADRLNNNIALDQIHGVVLIDEVDKHLHIRLQKEVLPMLLKLFPGIQFIVSSHSPFLNMGLASEPQMKSHIYDLDNDGIECEPTTNEIYQKTYELFLGERNTYAKALSEIRPRLDALTKPLVITEGKTDWKHLKRALEFFKSQGEFSDLDFELLEFDFKLGDPELDRALKHYALFPNRFKIVGVFDCDEGSGRDIHKGGGIKNYKNNVFGISLPVPDYRTYNENGISIEFLYKDEDMKKEDSNERRLYVTSEFNADGRYIADPTIGVRNAKELTPYLDRKKEKIYDHDVVNINSKSLALSKEVFATNILNSVPPFDSVDFSGFRALFERLKSVL